MGRTALVVNDDGITSPGLTALVEALKGEGYEVYVAAPEGDTSGSGKGMSLNARIREARVPGTERAWVLDAPPAAIVYIALNALLGERPSVVVSGVNHGPNLGLEDLFTSGTIGAALEAGFQGVPGIAVSYQDRARTSSPGLRLAARIGARLAVALERLQAGGPDVLIVNVPRSPTGAAVTRLAFNRYRVRLRVEEGVVTPVMEDARIYDVQGAPQGTDIWAFWRGLVSITPVWLDRLILATAHDNGRLEVLRVDVERLLQGGYREQ